MELREILDKNIIRIGLEAASKDDALKKMSKLLYENGNIDDVDQFVKDIYLREQEGITGIGNGVAIPHGKSGSVNRIGVAIATLKEGIEWETLDGNKVNMIFMFCVGNDVNAARDHLVLLSKVAAKLADDELLEKISKAGSPDDVVAYLGGD